MTMLEKMARAMCSCDEQDGGAPWDYHDAAYQQTYFDKARAALKAIREPSEKMCVAACRTDGVEARFTAMIDHILQEGQPRSLSELDTLDDFLAEEAER